MTLITLSAKEYQRLVEVVHPAHAPRAWQRAQAVLWLRAGEDAPEVAPRLFVTPRTVYRWVHRFHQRPHLAMRARLGESPRSGRPRLAGGGIDTLIARGLAEDPWKLGYRSPGWTVALLRQYRRDVQRIAVSQRRVSRALER